MNNVNMANMAQMGGPVGPPMQMMNSGAGVGGPVAPGKAPSDNRTLLNTYIYEYFLRHHMYDCARALLNSDQPVNVKDGSNRRRDENGADGDGEDSKEDMDSKRPDDLPAPNVPTPLPESCFLYEWFSLFWDMFNAQRGKATGVQVNTYVAHTQVSIHPISLAATSCPGAIR